MTNEELQSKTIDWLRFPLIAAVVLAHTIDDRIELKEYVSCIDYSHLSGMDVYQFIRILTGDVFPRIIIPCFFIFSGFLFFYKCKIWDKNLYFKKLKSRTRTLLVPYLLWNIIPVVLAILLALMNFGGSMQIVSELREKGVFKIFWNYSTDGATFYPFNLPLWYVRDLIIAAVLSPLVYYFVKYTKLIGVILLSVIYFTGITGTHFQSVMFFFPFGAYFAIHGKNMIVELRKGEWIWYGLALITMMISLYYEGTDRYDRVVLLFEVVGCIAVLNIASRLIEKGRVSIQPFLLKASFFLYVMHDVYISGISTNIVNKVFASNNAFILIVKYFVEAGFCVLLCLGLYWVASKTVPKFLGLLTGSR